VGKLILPIGSPADGTPVASLASMDDLMVMLGRVVIGKAQLNALQEMR
jgi:hypothetical protein